MSVQAARLELAKRELAKRQAEAKPHDPMNDPPRLPGEAGYVAEPDTKPKGFPLGGVYIDPIGDLKRYGHKVNDAAREFNEAPRSNALSYGDAALTAVTGAVAPITGAVRSKITGEPLETAVEESTWSPRRLETRALFNLADAVTSPISESGLDMALAGALPDAAQFGASRAPKPGKKTVSESGIPEQVAADVQKAKTQGPTRRARSLNTKLSPSEEARVSGNKNYFGRTLETIAGKGDIQRDMSQVNTDEFTKLTKKAIGAEDLTKKGGIKKVKDAGNAVYDEMSGIGTVVPDAELTSALEKVRGEADASSKRNLHIDRLVDELHSEHSDAIDASKVVTRVRELRAQAHLDMGKQLGQANDVQVQARGRAALKAADALDDWLERTATAAGHEDLGKRYHSARVTLAKANTVEDASRAGKVSAQDLYEAQERGAPLTGELADIAGVNEYFPEATNDARTPDYNTKRPTNILELPVTMAQSLIRPTISKFLQSDLYQNRFGKAGVGDRYVDNSDAFDQWPGTRPGDPNIGPPVPPPAPPPRPSVDFSGELGVQPDPGPRPSMPGGHSLQDLSADALGLRLAEDVTPSTTTGPNALRNGPDDLNFEPVNPGDVDPFRFQLEQAMNIDPYVRQNPLGESVPMAGDLQLAPDYAPGPYAQLPDNPGAPTQRPDPSSSGIDAALPRTTEDRLNNQHLVEWMLNQQLDKIMGQGSVDDMSLAPDLPSTHGMEPMGMQQQQLRAPGVQRTVTGYRGGPEGRDLLDTTDTLGNALFWAPDEYGPTGAANYGSNIIKQDLKFNNLLEGDTLEAVRQALGLQDSAELLDIINAARGRGHDGVTYDLKPGREYIQIPPK